MLNKIRKMESMEEATIVNEPALIVEKEYADKWMFIMNKNGEETTRIFNSKKEAKAQLNKVKKAICKMFENFEKFYSEKESWYELIILADSELDEEEIVDGNNVTLEIKLVEEEIMEEE